MSIIVVARIRQHANLFIVHDVRASSEGCGLCDFQHLAGWSRWTVKRIKMSRALKTVAKSGLSLNQANGTESHRHIRPQPDQLIADAELESELDRLLARRPVAKSTSAHAAARLSLEASNEARFDEGFTWEPIPVETTVRTASAPSAEWLHKARSEKRKSKWRNVAAWTATLAIGGAIIAASAYFLIGWRPDLEAVWAMTAHWLS